METRERILNAAAQVFAEIGYAGARVDDIAERAGINKAMLYYHVGDKQSLYATVLTDSLDHVLAALQTALQHPRTPSAKIRAILQTLAAMGSENTPFIPVFLREIASGGVHLPDEMILRMSSVFRVVAGVLAEGMAARQFRRMDPLLTHVSIVGATMFLVASAPVRRRVSAIAGLPAVEHTPAELATHVGNLVLEGLESPKAKNTKPKVATKTISRSKAAKSRRSRS